MSPRSLLPAVLAAVSIAGCQTTPNPPRIGFNPVSGFAGDSGDATPQDAVNVTLSLNLFSPSVNKELVVIVKNKGSITWTLDGSFASWQLLNTNGNTNTGISFGSGDSDFACSQQADRKSVTCTNKSPDPKYYKYTIDITWVKNLDPWVVSE